MCKDRNKPALQKHVEANDFKLVEHYWINPTSKLVEDWDVVSVPYFILIDSKGKIAYAGHPKDIPLEEAVEKLLAGEPLYAKKK